MNKAELIKKIAEKAEVSQAEATKALDAFLSAVTETLQSGDDVNLSKFGKFSVKERKARTGRNPKTGESVEISEGKRLSFKPSKELTSQVNT